MAGYLEYDVLLVNPVMDGLNLVAEEGPLVNRRDGALVLSSGAGAFERIGAWAVPVDPLDVPAQADALARAIALPREDRRERLEAIRRTVIAHDPAAWASRELAELRENAARRARRGRATMRP